MLFNLGDGVPHPLTRCIRVIRFKAFLIGETRPAVAAAAVTAIQPSVWSVVMTVCEEIHMNTITAKEPYGDELSEQMDK